MLLTEPKELPDLWTTTLQKIFAVRVGPDFELDNPLIRIVAHMTFDEAVELRFKLKLLCSRDRSTGR
jgi:hypothetical protein